MATRTFYSDNITVVGGLIVTGDCKTYLYLLLKVSVRKSSIVSINGDIFRDRSADDTTRKVRIPITGPFNANC